MELFLPMLQLPRPIITTPGQSLAMKRRYMTFAEAEQERANRTVNVALLNPGDMIGLESYVCELNTHLNSARCTAPCDVFYILKHNFLRLQKRLGTQGLTERLKELVQFSLPAYPTRILHLPLFRSLMKRQLAPKTTDEQQPYHQKQSWLLHVHNPNLTVTTIRSIDLHTVLFCRKRVESERRQRDVMQRYLHMHHQSDIQVRCSSIKMIMLERIESKRV